MDAIKPYLGPVLLGILALILQGVLSSAIAIGNAMPNFVLAFALIISIMYPRFSTVVICFILGLLYNLVSTGVVGSMALVTTLLSYGLIQFFSRMEGTHLLVAEITIFIAAFIGEILYGLMTAAFVSGVSVSAALVHQALPCGLYDAVAGCLLYPLPALFARVRQNRQTTPSGPWMMK